MANQFGTLLVNDNTSSLGEVISFDVSLGRGTPSVSAHVRCKTFYDNFNLIFDTFLQNQSAKVSLVFTDPVAAGGQSTRTIEFQNAIIRDYLEVFNLQNQSVPNIIDYITEFTIDADTVTMGDGTFPA